MVEECRTEQSRIRAVIGASRPDSDCLARVGTIPVSLIGVSNRRPCPHGPASSLRSALGAAGRGSAVGEGSGSGTELRMAGARSSHSDATLYVQSESGQGEHITFSK
jgi:hypothetical protein